MSIQPFVALDFETANSDRASACSVAAVKFDSNARIVDTFETLIRPHESVRIFDPINVWVHGIRPEDVVHSPEWDEIFPMLMDFIGDLPVVAHNMAFDAYVFKHASEKYCLDIPDFRRFCTLRLARKLLPELPSKGLEEVFDFYFTDESFEHHDASEDAFACGQIFARMQNEFAFEEVEEACPHLPFRASRQSFGSGSGVKTEWDSAEHLIAHFRDSMALEGERVTITGTLVHGRRADVYALVEALGGVVEKNLTKKTTILVEGVPNPSAWKEGASESRKLDKAKSLNEKGSNIQVMSEESFFAMLNDQE